MTIPTGTKSAIPTHNKHATYNNSTKGKARNTAMNDERYLSREFIAWDGEGVTIDGQHKYVLLANSKGGYIVDPAGLPTRAIFEFLTETSNAYPGRIHVIFGGGYDANCWLADWPRDDIAGVYSHDAWKVQEWRVSWRRGKTLRAGRSDASITVYDVMPFFQCPFVQACDDYLGSAFESRDMIVKNKAVRGTFDLKDLPEILEYCQAELRNLVALCIELRDRLDKAGLRISRWDGPGAIAAALMSKKGIKHAMSKPPREIQLASCHGYTGGRFEVIRCGNVERPAYEYDVNSAYPHGFAGVPNLARGHWEKVSSPMDIQRLLDPNGTDPRFWIGYAEFRSENTDPARFAPLFRRHPNGAISYPQTVRGWYWSPDLMAAEAYCEMVGGRLSIRQAYVFIEDNPEDKPFDWIYGLYAKRRALKKAGDGAHVGIKLGLNSLYGKTCQQLGAREHNGKWRLPPFHQLEWAGYVTATCRARVLMAALQKPDSVIAFETDALFTSEPLDLPIGSELGEFEKTVFDSLIYCQSGFYIARKDARDIVKSRGIDVGTVQRDQVIAAMEHSRYDRQVEASLTRFIGAGVALRQDWEAWRNWVTKPKLLSVEPTTGKRWHIDCRFCEDGRLTPGVWHETFCPFMDDVENEAYPIKWLNPNEAMDQLEEMRERMPEERAIDYD